MDEVNNINYANISSTPRVSERLRREDFHCANQYVFQGIFDIVLLQNQKLKEIFR